MCRLPTLDVPSAVKFNCRSASRSGGRRRCFYDGQADGQGGAPLPLLHFLCVRMKSVDNDFYISSTLN